MSSNTQLAIPVDIPAHIRELAAKAGEQNKGALGGIKAGSFPRISIGGSKFSVVEGGEKILLTDADRPDLPAMELQLAIVGFNPAVSKQYYEGEFEEGSDKEPTCSSDNGIVPDPHIPNPPSRACASCPKNVWGSKVTKQGKQVKACSDNKRIAVIPVHDLANEQALDFTIKPASLKPWAEYVRALDAKGIPVDAAVTKVQFDPSANFPKLVFKFGGFLTPEQLATLALRSKGDDVRLITSPRQSTATGPVTPPAAPAATPAPAPAPAAPAAPAVPAPAPAPVQPPVQAPAPTPAPAPVQPPVQFDPYAGLPPYVKGAVEGAGGLGTDAGKQTYVLLAGKEVPTAPAAPAPKPVDPFEGLPPHVKMAVDGAGGLASPAGQQVYKGLTGKDAPGAVKQPDVQPDAKPARKTRSAGKKSDATPPAPTPPAAAPAASAPAAASGGLGADLDALLGKAMAVPTK
jgi:hypothetical protein